MLSASRASMAAERVPWCELAQGWKAQLKLCGGLKSLGYFKDEEEAARAYDAEARKHFTEKTLPTQGQYGGFNVSEGHLEQPAAAPEAQAHRQGAEADCAQAGRAASRAAGRARRVLHLPRPARERAERGDLAVQRPGRLALSLHRRLPRGGRGHQGGVPAVPHLRFRVTRRSPLFAPVRE